MTPVKNRVLQVRALREGSRDPGTKKIAKRPHQFRDLKNPLHAIVVPRVTSERRVYAPVGFINDDVITTNQNLIIPDGTLYEFAFLSSKTHMDWLKLVGGKLESRYRYSSAIVYNTFPWPDVSKAQRKEIEKLGRAVILARAAHPDKTMVQLYDPDKMPENLLEAHQTLDRAVEKLYRDRPFRDTAERQEFLLARYEELIEAERASSLGRTKKTRNIATEEG